MKVSISPVGKNYYNQNARHNCLNSPKCNPAFQASFLTWLDGSDDLYEEHLDKVLFAHENDINKFIADKAAQGCSSDAAELLPYYNDFINYMDKSNVIKFINLFKNISIDKQQYKKIKFFLKEGTWQNFYKKLKPEDISVIRCAVNELGEKVELLPDISLLN